MRLVNLSFRHRRSACTAGVRAAVVVLTFATPALHAQTDASLFSQSGSEIPATTAATPQGQIALTAVPPYGSLDPLQGRVSGTASSDSAVAVYTNVPPAGWSNRPTATAPTTTIGSDGTWTCKLATGGNGEYAVEIVAFLVPAGYKPPAVAVGAALPAELYNYPYAQAIRYPKLRFANCDWLVKRAHDLVSPGPNYFTDDAQTLWVDDTGQLHLKIAKRGGQWYCSEIFLEQTLGHGRYAMTVADGVQGMDRNTCLDFFTWNDSLPDKNYGEMDIEFSRWGDDKNKNARYMVQPWYNTGNMHESELDPNSDPNGVTTHEFLWEAGQVSFRSYRGPFALSPVASSLITSWSYKGSNLPPAGAESLHLSLWLLGHLPPSDGKPVELTIRSVTYLPSEPNAVYRFWSPVLLGHFYTASESEKTNILRDYPDAWTYEGIAFRAPTDANHPGLAPVYRFWSAQLGDHFYTIDEAEKDALATLYPGIWSYEGIAFYAWPDGRQPPGTCPVYRFWSDTTTSHFYTASEAEKTALVEDPSHIWTYEGIAWHAYCLPGR